MRIEGRIVSWDVNRGLRDARKTTTIEIARKKYKRTTIIKAGRRSL